MKSEITVLPESRVKISIELTAEEFQPYLDRVAAEYAAQTKMPGFRKGKAPKALVERTIGKDALLHEAVDKAIPMAYYEAVQKHDLHPVDRPQVELGDHHGENIAFTAEVDVLPKLEIKDWRKIKAKKVEPEKVTEDAVVKVLEQLQKERATLLDVDRAIEKGDFAHVSYKGSVDGVEREGMASEHHPMLVGEGGFIPGFEEQLIGMKANEEKTFDITFPKDYHEKSLAKKKAQFTVTVEDVKEVIKPEIDDTFAEQFGQKTVSEMREMITKQLTEESEAEARAKVQDEVLLELAKRTKVTLPKSVIEQEIDRMLDITKQRYGFDDMQFATFLQAQKKTLDELRAEMRESAVKNVTVSLALSEVMKDLEINPEEQESIPLAIDKLIELATK